MADINIQVIQGESINKEDYIELTEKILTALTTQNGGVFEDVMDKFQTYLDSDDTIDNVQKQAAYAGFLKDVYSDLNRQALTSAMDLMKSNAQLSYEKYSVEAAYNSMLASVQKSTEEVVLLGKQSAAADKNNALLDQQLLMAKAQLVEQLAKNQKQYGVASGYTVTLNSAEDKYRTAVLNQSSGVLEFYETNALGDYLLSQAEVDLVNAANTAWNAANPTDPEYPKITTYVVGDLTTTDISKAQRFTTNEVINVGSSLVSTNQGAIDKQIKGYDYVNYKDVLKTADERAALMQNAKVPETTNEKAARLALIKALTTGVPGMPSTLA